MFYYVCVHVGTLNDLKFVKMFVGRRVEDTRVLIGITKYITLFSTVKLASTSFALLFTYYLNDLYKKCEVIISLLPPLYPFQYI